MTSVHLDDAIRTVATILAFLIIVFVVLSFVLGSMADRSVCREGLFYVNDRPVFVDGQQLQCKRLKLGREPF